MYPATASETSILLNKSIASPSFAFLLLLFNKDNGRAGCSCCTVWMNDKMVALRGVRLICLWREVMMLYFLYCRGRSEPWPLLSDPVEEQQKSCTFSVWRSSADCSFPTCQHDKILLTSLPPAINQVWNPEIQSFAFMSIWPFMTFSLFLDSFSLFHHLIQSIIWFISSSFFLYWENTSTVREYAKVMAHRGYES